MAYGHVKWWDDNKGEGCITDADGREYFVNYKMIQSAGYPTLEPHQGVEFEIMGSSDWLMATNVRTPGEPIDNNLCCGFTTEDYHLISNTNIKIFQEYSIRKMEYEINEWIRNTNSRILSVSISNLDKDGILCAIVVFSQEK